MAIYLEEFLYRGRPPGSADLPAWHVVLGDVSQDVFGRQIIVTSGAMTPEQAEAAGFGLPEIISGINTGALARVAALSAEVANLEAQLAALAPPE